MLVNQLIGLFQKINHAKRGFSSKDVMAAQGVNCIEGDCGDSPKFVKKSSFFDSSENIRMEENCKDDPEDKEMIICFIKETRYKWVDGKVTMMLVLLTLIEEKGSEAIHEEIQKGEYQQR